MWTHFEKSNFHHDTPVYIYIYLTSVKSVLLVHVYKCYSIGRGSLVGEDCTAQLEDIELAMFESCT